MAKTDAALMQVIMYFDRAQLLQFLCYLYLINEKPTAGIAKQWAKVNAIDFDQEVQK